jgi:hypothetical protein
MSASATLKFKYEKSERTMQVQRPSDALEDEEKIMWYSNNGDHDETYVILKASHALSKHNCDRSLDETAREIVRVANEQTDGKFQLEFNEPKYLRDEQARLVFVYFGHVNLFSLKDLFEEGAKVQSVLEHMSYLESMEAMFATDIYYDDQHGPFQITMVLFETDKEKAKAMFEAHKCTEHCAKLE